MSAEKTLAREYGVYGVDGCEAIGTGYAVLPDVVVIPDGRAVWEHWDESARRHDLEVALVDGRRVLAQDVHVSESGAVALELPAGTLCADQDGGLPGELTAMLGEEDRDDCLEDFEAGMQAWAGRRHPSLWCRIFPRMSACR